MSREDYIFYPALSASRIKQYYTGSLSRVQKSLDAGAYFHHQLLEMDRQYMDKDIRNVYDSIMLSPIGKAIFLGAKFENPVVRNVVIDGIEIPAKAMYDIDNEKIGIIADVKTTSCKNILEFKNDMNSHYNHIQAAWFSLVKGVSADKFYYIGVNKKARTGRLDPSNIMYYRHSEEEINQGISLIKNYVHNEWSKQKSIVLNR